MIKYFYFSKERKKTCMPSLGYFSQNCSFDTHKTMVRKQVGDFSTCKLLNFSGETMSLSPEVKVLKRISLKVEEMSKQM